MILAAAVMPSSEGRGPSAVPLHLHAIAYPCRESTPRIHLGCGGRKRHGRERDHLRRIPIPLPARESRASCARTASPPSRIFSALRQDLELYWTPSSATRLAWTAPYKKWWTPRAASSGRAGSWAAHEPTAQCVDVQWPRGTATSRGDLGGRGPRRAHPAYADAGARGRRLPCAHAASGAVCDTVGIFLPMFRRQPSRCSR